MRLYKGQNTGLIFQNKSLLGTPYYFIRCVHIATNTSVAWEVTNTATETSGQYRTVFNFTEGTDATLKTGDHIIYLYAQESSGNTTVRDDTTLIETRDLRVLPADAAPAPVAAFSADDTTPGISQVVTFTDATTNNPTSWLWSFSTAVTYTSGTDATSQNPKVIFATATSYTVTLKATSPAGSDSEVKTNYITSSDVPAADFTADDTTPTTTQTVTLTDTTTNSPTSWLWTITGGNYTLMNGSVLTDQNIDVRFDDVASYNIQLYAENPGGNDTELKSNYITVSQGFQNLYSMDFGGVNEYADVSSNTHLDYEYSNQFSFDIWAKFDTDGIAAYIVSKRDGALKRGYILLRNTSNQIEIYMQSSNSDIIRMVCTSAITSASGWNHIAWTYSGTGLAIGHKIYINGVDQVLSVLGNPQVFGTIQNAAKFQVSTVLDGHLTQLAGWNTVLTSSDVTSRYNSGTPADPREHGKAANLILYNQLGVGADYDSTVADEWYLPDLINSDYDLTSSNMELADRTTDVP